MGWEGLQSYLGQGRVGVVEGLRSNRGNGNKRERIGRVEEALGLGLGRERWGSGGGGAAKVCRGS